MANSTGPLQAAPDTDQNPSALLFSLSIRTSEATIPPPERDVYNGTELKIDRHALPWSGPTTALSHRTCSLTHYHHMQKLCLSPLEMPTFNGSYGIFGGKDCTGMQ